MDFELLLDSFRGRHDWRGSPLKRGTAMCKYLLRSLRHLSLQLRWLAFLRDTPVLQPYLRDEPRLFERPQHAYISRELDVGSRYAIIESHHRYLLARWPLELIGQIYRGGTSLGRLSLKDASEVELRLSRPSGRGREGELALYLLNAHGETLSSLIFTVADEGRSLLIGCVQGASPALGREAVREFTRMSHGLRPKNLLLSMLYAFAKAQGIARLCGVSNAAHPFAGNAAKIKSDYDGFWRECGGKPASNGFFLLPASEPARDIAEVESKHRSAFRRREALREQACALLVAAGIVENTAYSSTRVA